MLDELDYDYAVLMSKSTPEVEQWIQQGWIPYAVAGQGVSSGGGAANYTSSRDGYFCFLLRRPKEKKSLD